VIAILLATPDLPGETDLVARAPALGLRILRRCVDAIDLFAAAAADRQSTVVLSAGLPRLTRDVVDRLKADRCVLGLAVGQADREVLTGLGVERVVTVLTSVDDTVMALRAAVDEAAEGDRGGSVQPDPGVWPTGVWVPGEQRKDASRAPGMLVAVWGPTGAPGRTTIAIGLAEELAASGRSVGLVDADTYGPSVTLALGLVEDASGLVVACRQADNSTLSPAALLSLCHRIRDDWFVLGGVGRPERWLDLRSGALERLWTTCRSTFDVTIVDVGFCLENDEGGAWAPRRNAAAVSAVSGADQVVVVAESTALGAARLLSAWPTLTSAAPSAGRTIASNRSRGREVDRRRGWSTAVADFGIAERVFRLPEDDKAVERCWNRGRTLGEGARRSPLRRALATLAGHVVSG
jgi:hypothetical protein